MRQQRPLILVTNDDGFAARGLRELADLMRPLGDVAVVTTEQVMSSKSHSASLFAPLYLRKTAEEEGYVSYLCTGTPVDCVKLGYQKVLPRRPDLVVSGINHGSNAGSTVVYSATMGAVVEACMDGIPAVGFSIESFDPDAEFGHVRETVTAVARQVLAEGLPDGVCLNVNFPAWNGEPLRGVKVCRQSAGRWVESFEAHVDEAGETYYDLAGEFVSDDDGEGTDLHALRHHYASVVPTQYDWTAPACLERLKHYESLL